MAQFKVTVELIVNADDDMEAYHMAASVAENIVCGDIANATVGSVEETKE